MTIEELLAAYQEILDNEDAFKAEFGERKREIRSMIEDYVRIHGVQTNGVLKAKLTKDSEPKPKWDLDRLQQVVDELGLLSEKLAGVTDVIRAGKVQPADQIMRLTQFANTLEALHVKALKAKTWTKAKPGTLRIN